MTAVVRKGGRRYMPLWKSQEQLAPIPCDGGCLVVALNNVFVPGALTWDGVLPVPEFRDLFRLWMFMLERCMDGMTVGIETLVSDDYVTVNGSELSARTHVVGHRLWIPLEPHGAEMFMQSVRASVTDDTVVQFERAPKRLRISVGAGQTEPEVEDERRGFPRIDTLEELQRLFRLYYAGRGTDEQTKLSLHGTGTGGTSDAVSTMPGAAFEWDSMSGGDPRHTECGKTILEHFDVWKTFGSDLSVQQSTASKLYGVQRDPNNYVRRLPNGATSFFPCASIRKNGLMRVFQCGTGGFLVKSAFEILNYMRPHLEPTDREIQAKLERVLSAAGIHRSLKGMTRAELIRTYVPMQLFMLPPLWLRGYLTACPSLAGPNRRPKTCSGTRTSTEQSR
jgi:hypothetical protein